jgi:hypothetical protein
MWALHVQLTTQNHTSTGSGGVGASPLSRPPVALVLEHNWQCSGCADHLQLSAGDAARMHSHSDNCRQAKEDQTIKASGKVKDTSTAMLNARLASTLQAKAAARLAKAGANQPPPQLRKYLSMRLLVTIGILAYSCYPLFTSNMMQLLACQPLLGLHGGAGDIGCTVAGAPGTCEAKANLLQTYGTMHHQWLQQRFDLTANPADEPSRCHLGGDAPICQVHRTACICMLCVAHASPTSIT